MKKVLFLVFAPIVSFAQHLDLNWVTQLENSGRTSWGWGSEIDASNNVYHFGSFGGEVDFDPGADTYIEDSGVPDHAFIQKLDADGNFLWVNTIGATNFSRCNALTSDEDENTYACFDYRGTIDCDPGVDELLFESDPGSYTSSVIAKYDPDGNLIWAKNFSTWNIEIFGIDYHPDGYIASTGHFRGTLDFDPGPDEFSVTSTVGEEFYADLFILKMDIDGNFEWVKTTGNGHHQLGRDVDFDADGNIFATGQFNGTIDLDFGPAIAEEIPHPDDYPGDATSGDTYFLKLDGDGNYAWSFSFGHAYHDECREITIDEEGNMYAVGHFYGDVDMDPSDEIYTVSSNWGSQDLFVLKVSGDAELMWAYAFGSSGDDRGISMALGGNGNPYFAGAFTGNVDFDPGADEFILENTSGGDGIILELDEEGNFVGAGQLITSNILINDLEADSEGRIVGTGMLISNTDFDLGDEEVIEEVSGSANAFICSYIGDACGSLDLTVTVTDFILTAVEEGVEYQWVDCDQAYEIIPEETSQSYAPASDGNYAVIIDNGLCIDTSECVSISGLGLLDKEFSEFSIWPNPTNGQFEIRFKTTELNHLNQLIVSDISGRIIYELSLSPDQTVLPAIDLSNYCAGTYLVTVRSENGPTTKKLYLIH